jgi:hypothetical protein
VNDKVIQLAPPPAYVTDVPAALRQLAADIEAEAAAYGPGYVVRVTAVVRSSQQEPRVYGYGDTLPVQAFMDLHAGAQQLLHMKSPRR